jgi:hypothetical protein
MTEMYRCDICGDVVEYADIRRNVGASISHKYTLLVSDFDKKTCTFAMKPIKKEGVMGRTAYDVGGVTPDMCGSCYGIFEQNFKIWLDSINETLNAAASWANTSK